jgi:hypothetical protein
LDCRDNQLTLLNVSGCTVLQYMDCSGNRLTFAALSATVTNTYQPQKSILTDTITVTDFDDLKPQYNAAGGTTTYIWYYVNNTAVNANLIQNSSGVFTFDHSLIGQRVYCKMTNTTFPGLTLQTTPAEITDIVVLGVPQVTAVPSGNTVNLTWNAVSGATHYSIWRQDVTTGNWTTLNANFNGVTFTDSSVPSGQQLYAVRANKGTTVSGYKSVIVDTFVPYVTAAQSNGNVTLSWTAVSGADKYGIWRQDVVTSSWTTLNTNFTDVTFIDSSAPSGQQLYAVRAYKGATASNYNGVIITVAQSLGIPQVTATQSNGQVAATQSNSQVAPAQSNGQVTLNWSVISEATHYGVWRQDVATGKWTTLNTNFIGVIFTDTSAPSGKQLYAVRAYKGTTVSGYNGVIVDTFIPQVSAAVSGNSVQLAWSVVSEATHYGVWRQDVATGKWTTLSTNFIGVTFTDTSAPSGQHLYAVRAYKGTTPSGYEGITVDLSTGAAFDILGAALLEFDFIKV